jgi:hypothetical protein
MQQRQYRPGDVLDDYCPRERRVTDHAIVAMVEDEIQRTRCVSCDAEHEFKNAKVPAQRKKASTAALFTQVLESAESPAGRLATPASSDAVPAGEGVPEAHPEPVAAAADSPSEEPPSAAGDDRPFRRSLIRAQLPRPEGQPPPTRAIPEFTMHQPQNPRGKRPGFARFRRRPGGAPDTGGPMRFGREQGNGNGPGPGQGGRRRRRKKH